MRSGLKPRSRINRGLRLGLKQGSRINSRPRLNPKDRKKGKGQQGQEDNKKAKKCNFTRKRQRDGDEGTNKGPKLKTKCKRAEANCSSKKGRR